MNFFRGLSYFLALIRWPNLLIIGGVQFALFYVIIYPIYGLAGVDAFNHIDNLLLLILTTILISAAGYIINDYFDLRADRVNRPDKIILGCKIKRKTGYNIHIVLNVIAVVIGFYISYKAGSWRLSLIFPMIVILLWLYSVKYKRTSLWGNITIALLTAFVIIIVWLFEFFVLRMQPEQFILVSPYLGLLTNYFALFALFAFLFTFIREVIKDAEDIKGDALAGMRTFAVERGIDASVKLALVATGMSALLLLYVAVFMIINGMPIAGIYYIVTVFIPMIWFMFKIYKAQTKTDFHYLSTVVKVLMIAGILGLQPIAVSLN